MPEAKLFGLTNSERSPPCAVILQSREHEYNTDAKDKKRQPNLFRG